MNNDKKPKNSPEDLQFSMEMEELKRDVQAAQLQNWLQRHQQTLTIAVVVFLLAVTAATLWTEHLRSQKEAAASLYSQALNQQDNEKKQAALGEVIKTYGDTAYALLARQQLAAISDSPQAEWQAIMENDDAPKAFRWQARLDFAEYYLNQGKTAEAKALLQERTGKQYEQLRFYLLAKASDGQEKLEALRQAQSAESNDDELKATIESELALLDHS